VVSAATVAPVGMYVRLLIVSAEIAALLEQTPKLAELDLDDYDALVVCGGQGPVFQFRDNEDLKRTIAAFYEAEKPTAALCHGVCALLDVELSDGSSPVGL
jgi:putative intracellular protease/amidase